MVSAEREMDYHEIRTKITAALDGGGIFLDVWDVFMLFLDEIILRVVQIVFVILLFQNVVGQNVEGVGNLLLRHRVIEKWAFVPFKIWVVEISNVLQVLVLGLLYVSERGSTRHVEVVVERWLTIFDESLGVIVHVSTKYNNEDNKLAKLADFPAGNPLLQAIKEYHLSNSSYSSSSPWAVCVTHRRLCVNWFLLHI